LRDASQLIRMRCRPLLTETQRPRGLKRVPSAVVDAAMLEGGAVSNMIMSAARRRAITVI